MTLKVSVLMAVHNGETYLRQAIDSILNQTFGNFEFIIVDDCSTDRSAEIISAYNDPRIRVIRNETNLGLTRSLNAGIEIAAGDFIARMDSDDISLPKRLKQQVEFMESHPDVGACGVWARDIDDAGKIIADRPRRIDESLEYYYWIPSPLIHPSAMIRADVLKRLKYDSNLEFTQDFDLWMRIVREGYQLSNLPEYLFLYRVHPESISTARLSTQLQLSYESFCRNVTSQKISGEEYLSFYRGQYELSPVRRFIILWRLARDLRKPFRVFRKDNLRYTKMWLQIKLYKLISRMPGFSFLRSAKRQIKLLLSGAAGHKQSI